MNTQEDRLIGHIIEVIAETYIACDGGEVWCLECAEKEGLFRPA